MSKTIDTLVKDIQDLLRETKAGEKDVTFVGPEIIGKYGVNVAKAFQRGVSREEKVRPDKTFYASEIGGKCLRQLWYKYHMPMMAEPISASMAMKFMYGNIIEETVLTLAKLAGHDVSDEQASVTLVSGGIEVRGKIDAIIDGTLVDVKSVTSYGFKDFKEGKGGDKFGYREQLCFYAAVLGKYRKGFVAVDKQLGHIAYSDEHTLPLLAPIYKKLARIVDSPVVNPFDRLPEVTEANGNKKLCTECSYCAYKRECWKGANGGTGLKAYQYSGKVVFLTHIAKEPKVPELKGVISTDDD